MGAPLERAGLAMRRRWRGAPMAASRAKRPHDYFTDVVRRQPELFHQIVTPEEAKA